VRDTGVRGGEGPDHDHRRPRHDRQAAKALLDRNASPTNQEVRQALNGHLCRCASHNRIVRAVQRAAKEMRA
jgi:hypothetical protein